jgi:hypothetical protein
MWGIIRKDFGRFAVNIAIVLAASIWWLVTRERFDAGIVIPMGMLIFLALAGSVTISELNEEKHGGYRFLGTLPVRDGEIVAAKFILPLMAAGVLVAFDVLALSVLHGPAGAFPLGRALLIFSGFSSLVLIALMYLTIFMYGYVQVMRYGLMMFMGILLMLGVIGQLLIKQSILPDLTTMLRFAMDLLLMINAWLLAVCGVAVYGALMYVAMRVKSIE